MTLQELDLDLQNGMAAARETKCFNRMLNGAKADSIVLARKTGTNSVRPTSVHKHCVSVFVGSCLMQAPSAVLNTLKLQK